MANGRLANLKDSSYIRTDPLLAVRIGKNILHLPPDPFSVWDPSSGTGSLFYACAHTPWARKFGTEISAERAEESRREWPNATIVTAAFEAVSMHGQVDLVLENPPYFQQNGKRAALRFVTDAGEYLRAGGIMVAILSARGDWDGFMINHWLRWYDHIRVWKFPDRTHDDQEGAFDDYKQIVVVGIRRATQAEPTSEGKKWLQGYQWRDPEKFSKGGWQGDVVPPDLPETPIDNPYPVPSSREIPRLVVRNADEAQLLYALKGSGAHLAPAWQQATTWPESGYLGSPAMPYTGEAHIAAEIMIGGLDGQIVYGPGTGKDAEPHLFTAFVGQEWVRRVVEDEVKQKLAEQGCIRVEMKELNDKPILGVLNLLRGTTHYYQAEEVFKFLQPWLQTLSSRVIKKRKPLYRLDPADWEIQVTSQFGLDKQLPGAQFPGLAIPQLHRVFAMGRSLDVRGRTAIQGEPGTGKTRMATATAARQSYRWRHRNGEFKHSVQPAWVSGLRRSWLKNPRTLTILGLEPVYGYRFNEQCKPKKPNRKAQMLSKSPNPRVVAYRELATGKLIAPEDAGPKALPVLITTPLKVVKEYGKEIKAAYPQAEVMHIESHRDIQHWLERCATSSAPVVFGIFSHSTKQAFGRRWKPVVHEKVKVSHVPEMNPDPSLKSKLEPLYDERKQHILGYRVRATGKLLTREVKVKFFYCPDCGGRIEASPGRADEKEETQGGTKKTEGKEPKDATKKAGVKEPKDTKCLPVGSITWFVTKQRWCKCQKSRRAQDRKACGKQPIRVPLWQDDRTEATNRKYPPCSFAQWDACWTALNQEAERLCENASTRELVERVRRDDALLNHLVEVALRNQEMMAEVAELVERIDATVGSLRGQMASEIEQLSALLLNVMFHDEAWTSFLIEQATEDEAVWSHVLEIAARHEPAVRDQLAAMVREREERRTTLFAHLFEEIKQNEELSVQAVKAALHNPAVVAMLLPRIYELWPHLRERMEALRQRDTEPALRRVLLSAARREETLRVSVLEAALRDQELLASILEEVCTGNDRVKQLTQDMTQDQKGLVDLVGEVVRQHPAACHELLPPVGFSETSLVSSLVEVALRDPRSLKGIVPSVADREREVTPLVASINEAGRLIAERVEQAARRDSSNMILSRLVEVTAPLVDWQAIFFRLACEQAHMQSLSAAAKTKRKANVTHTPAGQLQARSRLTVAEAGPISFASSGKAVEGKISYDFRTPPPDSFSPYDYLYRCFRGCVALAVVDESHNGRSKDADISQAFRQAMRASQMRELTSGTHYGGDIIGFYHYWFSYNPQFWIRLGFGWGDAEKALLCYGVVQQWTREYESDAKKISGQTAVSVSTVPAPGLSAKLIPGLLEDLTYLTVLDVGAHMPPKKEIPRGISMRDPVLEKKVEEAEATCVQASRDFGAAQAAYREAEKLPDDEDKQVQLASAQGQLLLCEEALKEAHHRLIEVRAWASERDLASAYNSIGRTLEKKAREEWNTAARLAQGTIPRWFAALPCDSAYEVYSTPRDDWGNKLTPELVIRTPVLVWDYLYPMERYLIETVTAELAEKRTVMIYIEQIERSMAKRLEWVLGQAGIPSWTLPHGVEAEDRQQAILDALNVEMHNVVIVPYRLVNEGLNLHNLPGRRGIKTIIWYEQSMNLFMYLQASQRAWRLGADDEVRIYLPFYLGTAAHTKMRKLGGQSGAAAAFAGEPARGELITAMGADKTTLARLSASLEGESLFSQIDPEQAEETDDLARIEAAFARRNDELAAALKAGRQWFGVTDTLPERVAKIMAAGGHDIWAQIPKPAYLPDESIFVAGEAVSVEAPLSLPVPIEVTALDQPQAEAIPVVPQEDTMLEAQPVAPAFIVLPNTEAAHPSPAALVFGDEEDIRRARKQRGMRPRRMLPRLKNPVRVKHIPAALVESEQDNRKQSETEIVVSSLLEVLSFAGSDGTCVA